MPFPGRRVLSLAVVCYVGMTAATVKLDAGENYAFLVAVGDYDRTELKPLKFTRADILEFRQALVDSGFKPANIVVLHDDTKTLDGARFLSVADNIREEFQILLKGVEKGDTLIAAFAGHGIQFKGEQESYFCPRNAKLTKRDTLVSFADILSQLEVCPASRKLLLVDACRNEPQSEIARSRAEVNLESVTRPHPIEAPKSLLAFFSCGPGQQSFEDPDLAHGVFFHHVLKGWKGEADGNKDGRLEFEELHTYVRRETKEYVRLSLKAVQTPQLAGKISDEWVLRDLVATPAKATPPKPPLPHQPEAKAPGIALNMGVGPGWKDLSEKDFKRANCDPETFTWKDGVLHCTGNPVGVLKSSKRYTNFEFVLQWKHLKSAGNSGVFLWTTEESLKGLKRGGVPKGIEVQILDHDFKENHLKSGKKADWFSTHGDVLPVGVKMNPFPPVSPDGSRSLPRKELSKGYGEWNHYHIRAHRGEVRLSVNGEEVSGGSNCEPKSGYLCLESEGSPIEFKNMRIRELP